VSAAVPAGVGPGVDPGVGSGVGSGISQSKQNSTRTILFGDKSAGSATKVYAVPPFKRYKVASSYTSLTKTKTSF